MISKGKDILEKELRKRKISFNEILDEENIKKLKKRFKIRNIRRYIFINRNSKIYSRLCN